MTLAGRLGWVAVALAASVVPGAASGAPGTAAPGVSYGTTAESARTTTCAAPNSAFDPASVTIPGVVGATAVLSRGRDSHGVPLPPPLTDRGKWQLAWDRESSLRPGDPRGVVRFSAHTYPRDGSHGSALGNRLLARLRTGARLQVMGGEGQLLCYRVVRRVDVRAEESVPGYYSATGPARLAILVCSGTRRGPGNWSHRTIWYAVPVMPVNDPG